MFRQIFRQIFRQRISDTVEKKRKKFTFKNNSGKIFLNKRFKKNMKHAVVYLDKGRKTTCSS